MLGIIIINRICSSHIYQDFTALWKFFDHGWRVQFIGGHTH